MRKIEYFFGWTSFTFKFLFVPSLNVLMGVPRLHRQNHLDGKEENEARWRAHNFRKQVLRVWKSFCVCMLHTSFYANWHWPSAAMCVSTWQTSFLVFVLSPIRFVVMLFSSLILSVLCRSREVCILYSSHILFEEKKTFFFFSDCRTNLFWIFFP